MPTDNYKFYSFIYVSVYSAIYTPLCIFRNLFYAEWDVGVISRMSGSTLCRLLNINTKAYIS